MKKASNQLIIALSLIFFAPNLFAQWGFQMSSYQEMNDNPFHLPEEEKSMVTSISFGVDRAWKSAVLGYEGFYSYFSNMRNRNFYWHHLTLDMGSDTTQFNLGVEQRINADEYNLYDYWNAKAGAGHRLFVKGAIIFLSTNFEVNSFNEVSDLNNMKMTTAIGFNKSFRTKTTLIMRSQFEYKIYQNQTSRDFSDDSIDWFSFVSVTGDGKGNGWDNGNHGHDRGYMDGDHRGGFMAPRAYGDFANERVSQLVSVVRVAQSVTRTTGVALQFTNRYLLGGNSRYIAGIEDSYSRESEIFNDPMGYESNSVGMEMTKIFRRSVRLKFSAYWTKKNFSSQGIYQDAEVYDENIFRKDEMKRVGLILTKNIDLSAISMAIVGTYQWIDNKSNSYWYDYQNQYGALGLEFYF